MSRVLRHQAITASAGSGKTFQLAHRYLRLLVDGVEPDRVIALTFSRKAAGEIFDSIMTYLQAAARSDEEASVMSERLERPGTSREEYVRLLRLMTRSTHRLHIGTLDSFAVGILRTFPMELGIGSDLNLMENDGAAAAATRQEVFAHIYDHRLVDSDAQNEFRESFKQATFGAEEKALADGLEELIQKNHEQFMAYPKAELWGQPHRIWPSGHTWIKPTPDEVEKARREVERNVEEGALGAGVGKALVALAERAAAHDVTRPWDPKIESKIFTELLRDPNALAAGAVTIDYSRGTHTLNAPLAKAFFTLLSHLFHAELTKSLEKTQGLYRLLAQYENYYDHLVRKRGALTFHDAQYLLTPLREGMGGVTLSRFEEDPTRLYIDYRLDARLDHWLLDEFQDTSDLQWEVFRNLIDEVLQDTSGERSFFYVGDVKQAIYGWRGGNARLFNRILENYGPDCIEQRPLNTSFRSAQPILDVVNKSFGDFSSFDLPEAAVHRWQEAWGEHSCADGVVPARGYVTVLEPDSRGGQEKPDTDDCFELAAGLLKELDPINRGLETAILLGTNAKVTKMVDILRDRCPTMAVADEGRTAIADNPVVNLLLALVQSACHPGDRLAWRHLCMSPLAAYLEKEHSSSPSMLTTRVLAQVHELGFQGTMRRWGAILDGYAPLDAFGQKRLQDLVEAAGAFDQSGQSGGRAFIHFVRKRTIHEYGLQRSVRVMTLHQSKGLGFDVVVLPDIQDMNLKPSGRFGELLVSHDPVTEAPEWVLHAPRKPVCAADPALAPALEDRESRECFENLCSMYVAMTRAKRAMYLISSYPGAKSVRVTAGSVVKQHLCDDPAATAGDTTIVGGVEAVRLFETGDPDYVNDVVPMETSGAGEGGGPKRFAKAWKKKRAGRVTPSTEAEEDGTGANLFAARGKQARDEGTAIHALFEEVTWSDEVDAEQIARDAPTDLDPKVAARVVPEFLAAMEKEEVQQALARPEGHVELWPEKTFEMIHKDQWVTGTFDRVTITRDTGGKVTSVTVLDFKSNRIDDEEHLAKTVEHYGPQLELYAQALGRLLAIEPGSVRRQLLFTKVGRVVTV